MADSTIKVPGATRDHLAALAKERGTTIGALVTALAAEQLTAQQADQRAREARRVLREQMGAPLTDAEFDATPGALDRVYEIAAEKARDALRGAA
jgi:conjugal transfer/entry exclusion protein